MIKIKMSGLGAETVRFNYFKKIRLNIGNKIRQVNNT